MTNEETVRKLTEMKMSAMADSYREQMNNQDYQDMSFEDRFNLLVDHEYSRRQSNKLQRLINQAQFNEPSAAIEDIEYHPDRHLDKNLILELAMGKLYTETLEHHFNGCFWQWKNMAVQCLWHSSMPSTLQRKIRPSSRALR